MVVNVISGLGTSGGHLAEKSRVALWSEILITAWVGPPRFNDNHISRDHPSEINVRYSGGILRLNKFLSNFPCRLLPASRASEIWGRSVRMRYAEPKCITQSFCSHATSLTTSFSVIDGQVCFSCHVLTEWHVSRLTSSPRLLQKSARWNWARRHSEY